MKLSSRSMLVALGMSAGLVAAGGGFAACSSSNATSNGFGPDGSTGGSSSGGSSSCSNPTVTIDFAPMYSAYIPGDTAGHVFQIPAITDDGNQAQWTVSDPTSATLQTQTFNGMPGVMITVTGTNTVTVTATESSGACGVSQLNITSATDDDWTIGSNRYNDGVNLHLGGGGGGDGGGFGGGDGGHHHPDGGFGDGGFQFDGGGGGGDAGSFLETDGGTACTNCHGPTATNGLFNDVSHTPEQTGGFSDDDLIQIIVYGNVPDGGYFDPNVLIPGCDGGAQCTQRAYNQWHAFHQWNDIQADQYKGIVVYLRSLTPAPQNGTSNFGGGHHHDGGGGGGGHEGGGGGSGGGPGDAAAAGD